MVAVDAVEGGAARPGRTLVARLPTGIAEVGATRALQEVAAEGGHVAQLGAGGLLQALGDGRIVALDLGMVGRRRHLGQGAEPEPLGPRFDAGVSVSQGRDVDHPLGAQHVKLHQVDQGGSAGQVLDLGGGLALACLAAQAPGFGGVPCPVIGERAHQTLPIRPRACLIASTILG